MRINVNSMVMMTKYAIPYVEKNERGQYRGSIINLSSIAGMRGGSPDLMYATSKGAIINMTRAMAEHHAAQGIRVNCVCPGMVYTPIVFAGGGMSDEMRESRKNQSLLKTEGYGWDIGAAVRFLAGDEARCQLRSKFGILSLEWIKVLSIPHRVLTITVDFETNIIILGKGSSDKRPRPRKMEYPRQVAEESADATLEIIGWPHGQGVLICVSAIPAASLFPPTPGSLSFSNHAEHFE
ncbi:NAD(P)-binding protein [Ilyonectria robusta]